jgi:hypothetical protein
MPSPSDFQLLSIIEEAAVLCQAAESDFERLSTEVQKTVRESRRLTEGTLLEQDRARRRLLDARVRLAEHLHRRDPKAVAACYCKGRLWVCQEHPAVALDECGCGAPAVPCGCNPNRTAPPGYEWVAPGSQGWSRPRALRCNSRPTRHEEPHWHDISGPMRPDDGEQVLVRQQYDAEPTLVVYRATPVARWVSIDGVYVYQFRYFAQWCAPDRPSLRSSASS